MPISEKGITAFQERETISKELDVWLQQLQLRFPKVNTYEAVIDLTTVAANSYSTQSFTVEGLNINDIVCVNPPSLTTGLYLISYRVSAAGTLSLVLYNSTGSGIDEASSTFKIVSIRV